MAGVEGGSGPACVPHVGKTVRRRDVAVKWHTGKTSPQLFKELEKIRAHAGPIRHDARMKILIVEDEDAIAAPLVEGSAREGYEVKRVATGQPPRSMRTAPDVILLDLRLPDMDGYDVCRAIRARSDVPIIMVTARGEESDRVIGLELGADDYVVKPFGVRELIARIRAVTRRAGGARRTTRSSRFAPAASRSTSAPGGSASTAARSH